MYKEMIFLEDKLKFFEAAYIKPGTEFNSITKENRYKKAEIIIKGNA